MRSPATASLCLLSANRVAQLIHRNRQDPAIERTRTSRHKRSDAAKNLHVEPVAGLEGIKEASLTITEPVPEWSFLDGVEVKVAARTRQ